MYREFKAGDTVRAIRDVYSETRGDRLFARGEELVLVNIGGTIISTKGGSYVYIQDFGFSGVTIDRTQHFELVDPPKPTRRMSVAQLGKELGCIVEVVGG